MSDLPVPQPTEDDERLAEQFLRIKDETNLRGKPEGDQRCDNCHFYEQVDKDIAFCWHEKLEILVGADWWCDRWEEIGASDQEITAEQKTRALQLEHVAVEDNVLVIEPKYGERCDDCLFYLSPGDSVSYCWHPKVRIGVGDKWWCQWWEEAPADA